MSPPESALRTRRVDTPLGTFLVASTGRGLASLALEAPRSEPSLAPPPPSATAEADPAAEMLERAALQLLEYARRERRTFDLPLDLRGTGFQRAVWDELRRIPFGATRSYGEVALRIGRARATRAVGRASGANPLPIVVPCHRVLASDGIGGFSAGLEWKRRLLEHEGVLLFS